MLISARPTPVMMLKAAVCAGNLQLRVAVSGLACALFTSALVLAQVPEPAAPPAGATVEQKVEKVVTKTTKAAPPQKAAAQGAVVKALPKVRVPPAVRKQAAVNGVAANRNNLIQQWTTQARPLVRAELIFARNICKLDQETFRRINRDAGEVLHEVVAKMVDGQLQPRAMVRAAPGPVGPGRGAPPAPGARPMPARAVPANPDGGRLLQEGLAAIMKKELSPEQWSHYQAELDKRLASRKQIAVHYLVEALDRDLFLSDQQRARLTESLSSQWDDSWYVYLEYLLYGNQFFPMNIDPVVTPVLSDAQKKVWQGAQRVGGFWGFGGMGGGFTNDLDALEEELGEVKKAEPPNPAIRRRVFMKAEMIGEAGGMQPVEVRKVEMKKAEGQKAETKKAVAK